MEAHLTPCAVPKLLGFGLGAPVVGFDEAEESLHRCPRNPREAIPILEIPEEMSGLFFMMHRPAVGRCVVVVGLQG